MKRFAVRCASWLVLALVAASCGSTSPHVASASRSLGQTQSLIRYGDSSGDPDSLDNRSHFGVLSLPERASGAAPSPVVVLIHGGFWSEPWDYTLMDAISDDLVAHGLATWNIEFRRVGGLGGYPETFDDVSKAIDHLATLGSEHGLDVERTILMGHSSGGHLALWALGRENPLVQPLGAIGLAAVTDLDRFVAAQALLGGTREQVPERYAEAAAVLDPERVVLVHGDADRIVGLDTVDNAVANDVPVSVVAGADHFDVINPDTPAWQVARDRVLSWLAAPAMSPE